MQKQEKNRLQNIAALCVSLLNSCSWGLRALLDTTNEQRGIIIVNNIIIIIKVVTIIVIIIIETVV